MKNNPIIVKADHKVIRSYMYADDLVNWLMTIAEHSNENCPIYNVGSDQEILISDLASKIARIFNVEALIPEINKSRIDRYIPSLQKARNELGIRINFDLDQAISETISAIIKSEK